PPGSVAPPRRGPRRRILRARARAPGPLCLGRRRLRRARLAADDVRAGDLRGVAAQRVRRYVQVCMAGTDTAWLPFALLPHGAVGSELLVDAWWAPIMFAGMANCSF